MLRAGSHLVVVGAQHELLMEQDRYRAQFWAAFDAFVPGTALFRDASFRGHAKGESPESILTKSAVSQRP